MNGSFSSRVLGSDLATAALRGLERLRGNEPLNQEEEYAVERLYSWLGSVKDSGSVSQELANISDESQRAYLLSFRDRSDGARRQYILPKRPPRQDGETSSRSSTEDAEAPLDPQLEMQMQLLEHWDGFDVFEVARLTEGRPLQTVGLNLLRKRGLISGLQLVEDKLRSFLQEVEEEYQPNPYHSSVHAADVTQAVAAMLAADAFTQQLTELELLSLIVAAIIHDLGHPGVTNEFLVRTSSEAALQYNDQSINENMHLAAAFKVLRRQENNFLCRLPEDHCRYFRRLVIKIVLATDMAVHRDLVDDFTAHVRLWGPDLNAWPSEKRVVALQMLLHSADISNPARPLQRSALWGTKVQDEFFQQGDKERELGLSVSVVCDRSKASVSNNQAAFVEYVMKPSFLVLAELAPNFVARVMPHIEASSQHWQTLLRHGGGDGAARGTHPHGPR